MKLRTKCTQNYDFRGGQNFPGGRDSKFFGWAGDRVPPLMCQHSLLLSPSLLEPWTIAKGLYIIYFNSLTQKQQRRKSRKMHKENDVKSLDLQKVTQIQIIYYTSKTGLGRVWFQRKLNKITDS